ncbi:hydroxymethylbilane synthase [Puniceicoccales bacterium CK1056]|uniref:Hydroxymethylbilane synthase n=1 Tax=Oceanipulchritudo coccoides TaxID=2706888 RepID=A0A6B2M085_9BACT|nr:hydroxymethylbilane synthase [Oceanipulchritudo coccoides]NDV61756.1 hydroxymethylbilane synthase [Oceanipulchritudo coccoides]
MPEEKRTIRVVTRKSPLAMRQTEIAIEALGAACPHWDFELIPMSTTGDERLAWSLETSGGKGLFTSALEEAIVKGDGDLAVHSSKDLPTEMPEGVVLAGFLPRAPAGDLLIIRESVTEPALIATSSPRRRAQLKAVYPNAAWKEIRGNVNTRLRKISEGEAEATVMAQAGLYRLGIDHYEGLRFLPIPITRSVPAAGQGAIGLQVRAEDGPVFASLLCEQTARAVHLERAYLAAMGGGCHSATAAHFTDGQLHVFDEATGYRCLEVPEEVSHLNPTGMTEWVAEQVS